MDKQQLLDHRDSLLQAGLPYAKVQRHLVELQDHYRALQAEGLQRGMRAGQAASWASEQLGSLQQICAAMLAASSSRSWMNRYPKLMTMLVPVLVHVLTVVLIIGSTVFCLDTMQEAGASRFYLTDENAWVEAVYHVIRFFLMFLLTPLLAISLVVQAIRQKLPVRYWVSGVFVLRFVTSSLILNIKFPNAETGSEGVISGMLGYSLLPFNNVSHYMLTTLRLLVHLALAYGTGWWLLNYHRKQDEGFLDNA